jgi:hypothetical protein
MERFKLLSRPQADKSFEITHWVENSELMFGVAFGYSFSEFYSPFKASEYFNSLDRPMIEKQLNLVGANWFIELMQKVSTGEFSTSEQVKDFSNQHAHS